jgi:hypothetical protein
MKRKLAAFVLTCPRDREYNENISMFNWLEQVWLNA